MLLKTNGDIPIDSIKINFDTEGLWILNIALAVIMFGVALSIKIDDFKLLIKKPKILLVGSFFSIFLIASTHIRSYTNHKTSSKFRFGNDDDSRLPWWKYF